MRNYTVQAGDSLISIAVKFLYRAALSYKIRQINNLPSNNVIPGQVLLIPNSERTERKEYKGVQIVIDGKEIIQTPPLSITTGINIIAPGFSFVLPLSDIYGLKPYGFEPVDIYYGNSLILSGYVSRIVKNADQAQITVAGYGKSQMLSEVNYPVSAYPRTFYKMTLKQITTKLLDPFAIPLTIEDDAKDAANEKFEKVEIGVTETIADFIIDLADQKGLIVYGSPEGGIVFKNEYVNSENILIVEEIPATPDYDSSSIFSDYTCLKNYNSDGSAQVAREKIKTLNQFRPKVFTIENKQSESLKKLIKKNQKADLSRSFSMSIDVPYVDDVNGELIQINRQIHYKNTLLEIDEDFIIKGATYQFLENDLKATLELMPSKYLKGEL